MDYSFLYEFYKKIDIKCLKHIRAIDTLISTNLTNSGILTRPAKTNGLWCFTLLPMVMILYNKLYEVPEAYRLATYVSISLTVYSILFILFMTISCLVLNDKLWGGCIPAAIVGCLLTYNNFEQDLLFAATFTLPCTFLYSALLRNLLGYPKTFTIGEAMIVAQSIVISAVVVAAKSTCYFTGETAETKFIDVAIGTVLSTVGFIVTALYYMKQEHRTVNGLSYLIGLAVIVELIQLHVLLGKGCIPRLFGFVFMNQKRMQLIAFWLFLVLISVFVLSVRTRMAIKATTTTRKLFHIMAAFVFGSGILIDIGLLKFAAGVGFGVLILIEALRKSNIKYISPAIQSAFLIYSDEKDCGEFAMTPIYLYVGLAGPLWLVPHGAPALDRLAGVLATGVGDTAASWFGARYGRLKWPGGTRTLEGTAFNILSQIMTVYSLMIFDLLNCKNALIRTVIAATASGLVEARTDQVDNLILPLITLIAFQATFLLS